MTRAVVQIVPEMDLFVLGNPSTWEEYQKQGKGPYSLGALGIYSVMKNRYEPTKSDYIVSSPHKQRWTEGWRQERTVARGSGGGTSGWQYWGWPCEVGELFHDTGDDGRCDLWWGLIRCVLS
jgi:hypothetical protein